MWLQDAGGPCVCLAGLLIGGWDAVSGAQNQWAELRASPC